MKVRMLKDTNYMGFKPVGSEPEVDNSIGLRWINKGIAEPIVAEERKKDIGGDAGDDSPSKYAGMSAKELYAVCKERELDVEARRSKDYYIHALGIADGTLEIPEPEDDDVDEDNKEDAESGEDTDGDGKDVE